MLRCGVIWLLVGFVSAARYCTLSAAVDVVSVVTVTALLDAETLPAASTATTV